MKKNINFKYKLGMRAVKTALAVMISLYLSYIFKLYTPVFTTIAAITSMKASIAESLTDTKKRMFTSVFGVILGYLMSLINTPKYIEPIIAAFGILIVIYLLIVVDMKDMSLLSCIVFVASYTSSTNKLLYAFNRVIGTFIGIIVGVLINYLIYSPNVIENFTNSAKIAYRCAYKSLREIIVYKNSGLDEFNKAYDDVISFYDILVSEVKTPFHHDMDISREEDIMECLDDISVRLSVINKMDRNNLLPEIKDELSTRFKYSDIYTKASYDAIDEVYNYHVEYILRYIDKLKILLQ